MIIEVFHKLFVGDADGIDEAAKQGMFIIHAAKEPWHRKRLGYTGMAAPKDDLRYLWDVDDYEMWCNLVDAQDARYIPEELVMAITGEIDDCMCDGRPVFIHCNKGESRAPTMALCYLLMHVPEYTVERFKESYPAYNPGPGMAAYLQELITGL